MSKIRLTENQLHRVIKESVKKILREEDLSQWEKDGLSIDDINPQWEDDNNWYQKDYRDSYIGKDGRGNKKINGWGPITNIVPKLKSHFETNSNGIQSRVMDNEPNDIPSWWRKK